MKAEIEVALKNGVLDPQAKAILNALHALGFDNVESVVISKKFEISLRDSRDSQDSSDSSANPDSHALFEKIAHDVLSNPVIENYKIKLKS